jgi:hypothetical protein
VGVTVAEPAEPVEPVDTPEEGFWFRRVEPTSRDLARWVFLAYLAVSVPMLMWIGSSRWFFADEFSFLADRSATSFHDLMAPHNQHWSTIPVLSYRLLYHFFGLREYWPYQLLVVLAHVAVAWLLRMVMRRCGVNPWLATVAAGVYVLFGPGSDDILWAFQIGFTLSLVFGLGQMILADEDGPITRRDWYGLGLGGLALLTSGQAPPVILATGIAVLWRRGWRQAAFHTVPLGIIYGTWYVLAGAGYKPIRGPDGTTLPFISAGQFLGFLWTALYGSFIALGHFLILDWALVALVVVGVGVAWMSPGPSGRARRLGMPLGLVVGAAVGMAAAAPGRYIQGPDAGRANRYVGVTVAMALPLFAVAGDALMKRWRVLAPVVFLVFLLPMPWAATSLEPSGVFGPAFYQHLEGWISYAPYFPGIKSVPSWVQPDTSITGPAGMTVGWLRTAAKQGKLPPPEPISPLTRTYLTMQLGVAVRGGSTPAGLTCRTSSRPIALDPPLGTVWRMDSPVSIGLRGRENAPAGIPKTYAPDFNDHLLQVTLPNLQLRATPVAGATTFTLCT